MVDPFDCGIRVTKVTRIYVILTVYLGKTSVVHLKSTGADNSVIPSE